MATHMLAQLGLASGLLVVCDGSHPSVDTHQEEESIAATEQHMETYSGLERLPPGSVLMESSTGIQRRMGESPEVGLSGLPPAAAASVLGERYLVETRIIANSETEPATVEEIALSLPSVSEEAGDRDVDAFAASQRVAAGIDNRIAAGIGLVTDEPDLYHVDTEGYVEVYVRLLPEIPPDAASRVDWTDRAAWEDPRAALRAADEQRQLELAAAREVSVPALQRVTRCEVLSASRAAHAVHMRCTEDEFLRLRASESATLLIESIDGAAQIQSDLDGEEFRAAEGLQTGHAIDLGYDGEQPGPAGSGRADIQVALIDTFGFHRAWEHHAYDDWAGVSRIRTRRYCDGAGCLNDSTDFGPQEGHGANIMGSFADLNDGQALDAGPCTASPDCPSGYFCSSNLCQSVVLLDREQRSFHAPEAHLDLYWAAESTTAVAVAIEDAASYSDGTDIISISLSAGSCGSASGVAAIRDAWDYAYSLGTIGVLSAGNHVNRHNDDCRANGYATRPDIIVVGGYGDNPGSLTPNMLPGRPLTPIDAWDLNSQPLMGWHYTDMSGGNNCPNSDPGNTSCWSSAIGGADIRAGHHVIGSARAVLDLVAPAGHELPARIIDGRPVYRTHTSIGTSQAAPVVASSLVSLLDWAYDSGLAVFVSPGIVQVNALLWGDGTRGGHDSPTPPSQTYTGMHELWGAGRIKVRVFDVDGLDYPHGWATGTLAVGPSDEYDILIGSTRMNSDVEQLRAVMAWEEANIFAADPDQAADILFSVVTTPYTGTCTNPGGSGGTLIAGDFGYDTEKLVVVQGSDMTDLHGECVWLRIQRTSAASPSLRQVHYAYMYEDQDRESWENLDDIE